jgi:hypothetical protein
MLKKIGIQVLFCHLYIGLSIISKNLDLEINSFLGELGLNNSIISACGIALAPIVS